MVFASSVRCALAESYVNTCREKARAHVVMRKLLLASQSYQDFSQAKTSYLQTKRDTDSDAQPNDSRPQVLRSEDLSQFLRDFAPKTDKVGTVIRMLRQLLDT